MEDMQPLSQAAEIAGVSRITLGRWVQSGKLKKKRSAMVRNMKATLVSVAEVRAIVAKGVKPGRPKTVNKSPKH